MPIAHRYGGLQTGGWALTPVDPQEAEHIAFAFRAGEQKERDRVASLIEEISSRPASNEKLGVLVWTRILIEELGLKDKVVQ